MWDFDPEGETLYCLLQLEKNLNKRQKLVQKMENKKRTKKQHSHRLCLHVVDIHTSNDFAYKQVQDCKK